MRISFLAAAATAFLAALTCPSATAIALQPAAYTSSCAEPAPAPAKEAPKSILKDEQD